MRSWLASVLLLGCVKITPAVHATPPAPPPVVSKVEVPARIEAWTPPSCPALDPGAAPAAVEVPKIVDASGRGLARFHARLAELTRGTSKEPLRIAIYGDSNMTTDRISGELRRRLQGRFGDAGHGFVALGKPWNWYLHTDVLHDYWATSFKTYAVSSAPVLDRIYGLAGIAVEPLHPGATTWVKTSDAGPVGHTFDRLELFYLENQGAGRVTVRVDGADLKTLDARGKAPKIRTERFELPDAPHKVEIVSASVAPTRLFGVTLERANGVVVDSLGVGALNSRILARLEPDSTRTMLAMRRYDLVIFLLDTTLYTWSEEHLRLVRQLIELQRSATPDVSLLVLTPPDHVTDKKAAHSDPRVVRIANEKRLIAEKNETAFWDLREAMGGDRSIVKWSDQGLAWTDFIHFNEKGARKVGEMFTSALWQDFVAFAAANPRAGCD